MLCDANLPTTKENWIVQIQLYKITFLLQIEGGLKITKVAKLQISHNDCIFPSYIPNDNWFAFQELIYESPAIVFLHQH